MSAARGAASSCRRSSSGRYQRSTAASSPGQGAAGARKAANSAANAAQAGARRRRAARRPQQLRRRIVGCGQLRDQPARVRRADARHELQRAQAARWPRGLAAKRSTASTSLTCAASRNLQAAVLDERDVAPRQLELERVAVLGGCERAPPGSSARVPISRSARTRSATHDASRRLVVDPDQRRRARPRGASLHSSLAWRSAARRDDRVRGGQHRRSRAVVLLEREHGRRRREASRRSRGCCAPRRRGTSRSTGRRRRRR